MTPLDRLAKAQDGYLSQSLSRPSIDDVTAREIADRHTRGMWHPALRSDTIMSWLLVQRHQREQGPRHKDDYMSNPYVGQSRARLNEQFDHIQARIWRADGEADYGMPADDPTRAAVIAAALDRLTAERDLIAAALGADRVAWLASHA